MKKIITFSFILSSIAVLGQQESQFTHVNINPYLVNPGAIGLRDIAQIEIGARYQWLGYDGGPRTFYATANSQLFRHGKGNSEYNPENKSFQDLPNYSVAKTKHVVGAKVFSDNIGIFSKNSVYATYAYHLPFSRKINLGLGISGGLSNFSVNESKVTMDQSDDESYANFFANGGRQNMLDFQTGLVFYGENYLIGVSATQLLQNQITFDNLSTESTLNRHVFVHGHFRLISKENFSLEPNAILKITGNSPKSLDFGARMHFQKTFWASVTYRSSNAAVVGLGMNLVRNLYVSYAFEMATSQLRGLNSGTHQMQLGINLGRNRNVKQEIKESSEKSESK